MSRTLGTIIITMLLATSGLSQWTTHDVATKASLRGLSVVNEKVVWASGTGGTVVRTADGGKTWSVMAVPGAEKLDFRDIEAFDLKTAYILSIGNGEASRIYKTADGGSTWKLQFTNRDEKAFYDAIACWDSKNCIAMSDPVDGFYRLLETRNGGETWTVIDTEKMDNAKAGEAAFAASGTCLYTVGKSTVFLVTGGSDARVFRSEDRGWSWSVAETPIAKGTAGSGIFSIAFRNTLHGTIVGGNYEKPSEAAGGLAFTRDGGKTWYAGDGLRGYRSAVTYIDDKILVAVGTTGADISFDRGGRWLPAGDQNFNSVAAKGQKAVWAVGPNGLVARMKVPRDSNANTSAK
jgi:photosystem II stability/assembly factor-like uncharacterized protein